MADDLAPEPVSTASPSAPAPAPVAAEPSPAPQPLAQQLESATGTVADQGVSSATLQAPEAHEWQGVRDYAKANGVELPFQDDAQALNALLAAHRQANERNYYADLGRTVAPFSKDVATFLQQRRQQQAAPQAPPAWQGPEFKKEWLALVEKDENTGRLRSKAGYDPSIAEKVEKYAEWREGYLEDPAAVIGPLVEQRAQQLIDARFAQHTERTLADQLVARDAGWMFQADAQGAPVFTPQGQRQLTPEGVLYARAADSLWRSGVRDVRTVHALARGQVENAVMRQRLLQLQPAAAPGAAATVAATTDVGGQLARPSAASPPAAPSQKGLSLRERLMVNLDRAGAPEDLDL